MTEYIFYFTISDKKESSAPKRCLQHGFSVHTKFELTPPFPPFAPRTQLKINGVAVVNTGDSIIALHVAVGNSSDFTENEVLCMKESTDGLSEVKGTERPILLRSESSLSEVCSECGCKIQDSENRSVHSQDWERNDDSQKENVQQHAMKEYFKQRSPKPSPGHSDFQGRSPKPSSADWYSEHQGKSPRSGSGDWNSEHQGKSPRSGSGDWNSEYHGRSPKSNSGDKYIDCHDLASKNGGVCDNNSQDCFEFSCESPSIAPTKRERSRNSYQQQQNADYKTVMSPKMDNTANNTADIKNVMSPKSENSSISNCTPRTSPRANIAEGRCMAMMGDGCCQACGARQSVPHMSRSGPVTTPSGGTRVGLSSCNTNVTGTPQTNKLSGGSQRSFWSPSVSSGTSRSTDSIYLQTSESKTVSYMVRMFSQVDVPDDQDPAVPTDGGYIPVYSFKGYMRIQTNFIMIL